MKITTLLLAGLALFQAAPIVAIAAPVTTIIGFDDLDASSGDVPIGSPYAGVNWANFLAYTTAPGLDGFNNGIVSGPNAAYSGGEFNGPVIGSISAVSGSFDLASGAFGAGYYDGLALTLTGLRGGIAVFNRTLTLDTGGAQSFTFNFAAIDQLTFTALPTATSGDPFACGSFNCTQFTVDDLALVLNDTAPPPPPVQSVPEPGSLVLLFAGLAGLGMAGRRRAVPPPLA